MGLIVNPFVLVSPVTWADAWTAVFNDTDEATWTNYTMRHVISTSAIVNTGTHCRVQFTAPAIGLSLYHAYIGLRAGAGDSYDFAATPTELLFSGASGFSGLAGGATIFSDDTLFTIDDTTDLVVSFRFQSDGAKRGTVAANSGVTAFYKNANDAATVNATGYTSNSRIANISKIQVHS